MFTKDSAKTENGRGNVLRAGTNVVEHWAVGTIVGWGHALWRPGIVTHGCAAQTLKNDETKFQQQRFFAALASNVSVPTYQCQCIKKRHRKWQKRHPNVLHPSSGAAKSSVQPASLYFSRPPPSHQSNIYYRDSQRVFMDFHFVSWISGRQAVGMFTMAR